MTHDAFPSLAIRRPDASASIFRVDDRTRVFVRAGTTIGETAFANDTEVEVPAEALVPGADFFVRIEGGKPVAVRPISSDTAGAIGGFHVAPGGNATARAGGDTVPAINPLSCWDAGFRPACPDPRGMTLVTMPGGYRFWCDIYLFGTAHSTEGSSRHGAEIADGNSMPEGLDFARATEALALNGKRLLTYDEFRAAPRDPRTTGLDAARTSRFGLMQATGNLWAWGTDGDPDNPCPSLFGGSWLSGSNAGSRYADLGLWPGNSDENVSARGRCDHMQPA